MKETGNLSGMIYLNTPQCVLHFQKQWFVAALLLHIQELLCDLFNYVAMF